MDDKKLEVEEGGVREEVERVEEKNISGENEAAVGSEGEGVSPEEKKVEENSEKLPGSDGSIYLDNGGEGNQTSQDKKPRRLTRAERARQEALASFGGSDLASVTVKKRDLHKELQRDARLMKQGQTQGKRVTRKTRVQESSAELKEVLYGSSQGLSRKRKIEASSEGTDSGANPPKVTRRMTKAEKARQDALKSFGGCGFDDVMVTSRKKIAKTFEMKTTKDKGEGEEDKVEGEEEIENVDRITVET